MKVKIKQNALIAKIAAKQLKQRQMAIVLGQTIYLWNVSSKDFLENKNWLRHEATHVKQFQQYGFVKFLILYLKETFRNGYKKNRFEIEAIEKEKEENALRDLVFIQQ